MQTRRLLAAVLAVGQRRSSLTACAGDDSRRSSSTADRHSRSSASGGQGHGPHLAARTSPRPRSSPRCTPQLLEKAGYTPDVKLVDTRDVYMADLPERASTSCPEYVGGIVDFLNAT